MKLFGGEGWREGKMGKAGDGSYHDHHTFPVCCLEEGPAIHQSNRL